MAFCVVVPHINGPCPFTRTPGPAMSVALAMRHRGVQEDKSFSGKVISALRAGVGGFDKKK